MMRRDQYESFDKRVPQPETQIGNDGRDVSKIDPQGMQMLQELEKCMIVRLRFVLVSICFDCLTEPLQMRLRHIIFMDPTFADALIKIDRISLFPLSLVESFLNDGLLAKTSFPAPLLPILDELTTESVLGAPLPILLDRLQVEGMDVR